jgi:tetratricopeptide (TPR) repeat protein
MPSLRARDVAAGVSAPAPAARLATSPPGSPVVARARRFTVLLVVGLALALAGPAAAQRRVYQPPPDPPLTTEQAETLHRGMLELRQLERTGNRADAIHKGEELLHNFPGNRRVEDVLLNLYRVERRDDALIDLLRVRVKREPADPDATRDLAALLLNRGDTDGAVAVLRHHIADNPKDENRYRLAGALLASRDQTQIAIDIYREGRDAIGVPSLFAAEVAQMEIERGDFSSAIAEYLLLATDPDRRPRVWREVSSLLQRVDDRTAVLERIEEMRRKYPRTPAIQDIAAMAYLESGRYAQALSAIREADRWADDQGEHLLDFGRVALQGGGPDSLSLDRGRVGVDALDLLTQVHPESGLIPEATRLAAEGLVNLARRLPEMSDERKALLQQAVRIIGANRSKLRVPQLANQLRALQGMILLEDLGQPAAALEIFEEVAAQQRQLGEPDQLIRVQVALCQAALGHLDVARTALEEIVRTDSATALPDFPGHRRPNQPEHVGWARARYYLAEFDLIDGKYDEAKKGFADLAEESPEDRLANDCLDLALILNETAGVDPALPRFGSYRRALLLRDRKGMRTELQALVRENPSSTLEPIALYDLGGILAEDRDTSRALEAYQQLLDEHPDHRLAPRSLEAIGDLQLRTLGRPELAVASYEKLLLTYPDDLFLDGVRKKLLTARAAVTGGDHATP